MKISDLKARIKDQQKIRSALLLKGESIKNIEEALVDDVTYLRSIERDAAEKAKNGKAAAKEKADKKAAAAEAKAAEEAAALEKEAAEKIAAKLAEDEKAAKDKTTNKK